MTDPPQTSSVRSSEAQSALEDGQRVNGASGSSRDPQGGCHEQKLMPPMSGAGLFKSLDVRAIEDVEAHRRQADLVERHR